LKHDDDYAADYEVAKGMIADKLEDEVFRRGHDGVEEKVGWYQGQAGGTVQRYDSNLLMFATKKHIPEYRDQYKVDVTHNHQLSVSDAELAIRAMVERNPDLLKLVSNDDDVIDAQVE
jgi:hypothetical protein